MMDGVFISLRLSHPVADVTELCKKLGLTPDRAWLAGQSRQTPKGVPLKGVYAESYCTCSLPIDRATYLEEGLQLAVAVLKPHVVALVKFSKTGGRVSFFISLEKGAFRGAELSPTLLTELADLHVSLAIDRNL